MQDVVSSEMSSDVRGSTVFESDSSSPGALLQKSLVSFATSRSVLHSTNSKYDQQIQEEKTFILEEQFVRNKFVPKNHSGEEKGRKSGATP
jgi:hypothetical protein